MIDDIRKAAHDALRDVIRSADGPRDWAVAQRAIRIEVDHEAYFEIERWMYQSGIVYPGRERTVPDTLDGFALYKVFKLPAPGWRIVNPWAPE